MNTEILIALSFNLDLVTQHGGWDLAALGMSIVFTVLAGISIFIALLPKVLEKLDPWLPEPVDHTGGQATDASDPDEDALMAAIAMVAHQRKQR